MATSMKAVQQARMVAASAVAAREAVLWVARGR